MDDQEQDRSPSERLKDAQRQFTSSADMLRDAWTELQSGAEAVRQSDSLESALETARGLEFETELLERAQEAVPFDDIEETLRRVPRRDQIPTTPPRGPRRGRRRIDTSNLPPSPARGSSPESTFPDIPQIPEQVQDFLKTRGRRIARGIAIFLAILIGFSILGAILEATEDSGVDITFTPTTTVAPTTTATTAPATTLAPAEDPEGFAGTWTGIDRIDGSTLIMTIDADDFDISIRDDASTPCDEEFAGLLGATITGRSVVDEDTLVASVTLVCDTWLGRKQHPGWLPAELTFTLSSDERTLDGLDACWHRQDHSADCDL